jgi:hypothetical protein
MGVRQRRESSTEKKASFVLKMRRLVGSSALGLIFVSVVLAGSMLPANAVGIVSTHGPSHLHHRDLQYSWNAAIEVPGSAGLNSGGNSSLDSVSCSSQGDCGAGGTYFDADGNQQIYVADEHAGVWGAAIELPGMSALNVSIADLNAISCSAPGNCSAVGDYTDANKAVQAFVVTETNGVWGDAHQVPNLAASNVGGLASALTVSCASSGNCSAGGFVTNAVKQQVPFDVSESNGTWGSPSLVSFPSGISLSSGTATSTMASISCWTKSECAGGGFYQDSANHLQPFSYLNGDAVSLPSVQTLNIGGSSTITSVSCDAQGYCGAVGKYTDAAGNSQAFAMNGDASGFASAVPIPVAALNIGAVSGDLTSVACPSSGNCSAVGNYTDGSGGIHAFTVDEKGNTWGPPQVLANLGEFGPESQMVSISCTNAGDCIAGGLYGDADSSQAFVVIKVEDFWQPAIEAPGTASLDWAANASVLTTSCSSNGYCAAGGDYLDQNDNYQSFVTTIILTRLHTQIKFKVTVAKLVASGHSKIVTFDLVATGLGKATGTVNFFRTGVPLCTAHVIGGKAMCSATKTMERKSTIVYAIYSGDSQYAGAVLQQTLAIK